MIRKFFPLDKNYLLEQAQMNLKKEMIGYLIEHCKTTYLAQHNPLGILDETTRRILEDQTIYCPDLHDFYHHLCGIYRYRHGDNQLQFLFDGKDHLEYYNQEWRMAFKSWIIDFGRQMTFLRAILELTVFSSPEQRPELIANRLKAFVEGYFNLKVYKYRGIIEMRVA